MDYSNSQNHQNEYYNSTIFSMNHKMEEDKIYKCIYQVGNSNKEIMYTFILFKELNKISIRIRIFCLTISELKVQCNRSRNHWKIRR